MPGPPPTPAYLKLLRGNPGQRRVRPEPEPARAETCPDPPSFLSGYAADEWRVVAPELHRMRLLTAVDLAALAAYCHAYATWRVAHDALDRMAKNDPVMSALVIKARSGDAVANPLVMIARRSALEMLRFATEFGLGPAARSRMASAGWEPPEGGGRFGELLKG